MTPARPDRTGLTDEELVRLVRGGETDAFAEVVRRVQRPAYRLAIGSRAMLRTRTTSSRRASSRPTRRSTASSWVAPSRRGSSRSWRAPRSRRSGRGSDAPRRRSTILGRRGRPVSPSGAPIRRPIPGLWERRLDVERAYARLSEEHQVILALRVEADLSYAQIAETLGVPVGTVMSRLARAREALMEQMTQTPKADER